MNTRIMSPPLNIRHPRQAMNGRQPKRAYIPFEFQSDPPTAICGIVGVRDDNLHCNTTVYNTIGVNRERAQGMPATERDAAVQEALREVHLDPATRHRYPHEFSGGQRQRIAIARAMALKPQLIVLDEPTSALDRTVQKQIVELLRELQGRYGFACLFISHDLAVVRALCHRILVMQNGREVESRDNHDLFSTPAMDYTQRLLAAAGLKVS